MGSGFSKDKVLMCVSSISGRNMTNVTDFFLLGFQVNKQFRIFLFCLFLFVYWGTICGNLLIITLVSTSKILHNPMYFFISQLSISDILLSTDIVPNLLHILLNNGATITFIGCITQYYFFGASEMFECLLLAVMSYDRYVAICNPLRYTSIMTRTCCMNLALFSWCFSFFITLISSITTGMLKYCGPNIIDHFFCDINPLLDLACSDTFTVHFEITILSSPIVIIPTIMIIVSYVKIIVVTLRIPSSTGRQKAFSTCSSHLIVVSMFYGTIFSVYAVPTQDRTLTMSKLLSLLYTVFTPFINPIIYSLKNYNISKALKGILNSLAAFGKQIVNEKWRETQLKLTHNAIYAFTLPPSILLPDLTSISSNLTPLEALFHIGLAREGSEETYTYLPALAHPILTMAKHCILQEWIRPTPPTLERFYSFVEKTIGDYDNNILGVVIRGPFASTLCINTSSLFHMIFISTTLEILLYISIHQ
ncbi:olfactory receptor 5G3-like [Dendropsophus ebraccatus]|uniref:olfactory receptor 5G3-like n=1 Tax=Dendropsophus ebraccatus TaxID=150705 RepID=UPI00383196AD